MRTSAVIVTLFLLAFSACSEGPAPATDRAEPRPLEIFAVNYSLAWFAEQAGSRHVNVRFPVPEGIDPADWTPDAETLAVMREADLILRNGAGYAAWVDTAGFSRESVIDTSESLGDRLIPVAPGAGSTSLVWLDMRHALQQVREIGNAIIELRPDARLEVRADAASIIGEMIELDEELLALGHRLQAAPLLFAQPVYAYLARRYALNGRSLEWEPNALPDPSDWSALEELLAEHPAHVMLWESEPRSEVRSRLAALGIQSVVYRSCANRCGDWLEEMRANVARFRDASMIASMR